LSPRLPFRLLPSLHDELVGQADIRWHGSQPSPESREDRAATLEDESIIVGSRDEHVTGLDAKTASQGGRHDESSLRTNDDSDCRLLCHGFQSVPYRLFCDNWYISDTLDSTTAMWLLLSNRRDLDTALALVLGVEPNRRHASSTFRRRRRRRRH
jgi:hypothetical protein